MPQTLEKTRETGPWDDAVAQLERWDPGWAETCAKMTTNPWTTGVLPRKFIELVGIALGLLKRETLEASLPAIGGGGLAGVVCVAVILFVALIPFFAFRNVSRELGPGQLNAMLFGTVSR